MSEEFIDTTIAALKIIGMVPKNGKLCVRKGQLALDVPDRMQFVRRWTNGDSRDLTLMHIRNTINSAIKICKGLLHNADSVELSQWSLGRILEEMERAQVGIQNLKTTYLDDSAMIANLDVLADRLIAHRDETERKFVVQSSNAKKCPPSS